MATITREQVLETLRNIVDPDLHRDIVSLGFVKDVVICDGAVKVVIELTTPACPVRDQMKAQAETLLRALPGVTTVNVEMTAQVRQRTMAPEDILPGVKHIVAIASGKGGVGKSTVAVNLAVALAEAGARVGLLDADVYGPSLPKMLGCQHEKPLVESQQIIPIRRYGLSIMSLGFLLEEEQAAMWRGPIVAGTVRQLFVDVRWGELDYLIVDLPPGTGDAPMTTAQLVPLTGGGDCDDAAGGRWQHRGQVGGAVSSAERAHFGRGGEHGRICLPTLWRAYSYLPWTGCASLRRKTGRALPG
jgi:ATP-binding protein involved in chromosome partitioning